MFAPQGLVANSSPMFAAGKLARHRDVGHALSTSYTHENDLENAALLVRAANPANLAASAPAKFSRDVCARVGAGGSRRVRAGRAVVVPAHGCDAAACKEYPELRVPDKLAGIPRPLVAA